MAPGSNKNQATVAEFKSFDIVPEATDHHFLKSHHSINTLARRKIMKEWRSLEKDLPDSIYVQTYETRIDLLRAVIIGPEGTPYHNGLFFFDIRLPSNYPFKPPKVYYHSHGLRLNPNLYEDGTVCLSIINTWYGDVGEIWTKDSTILQVLVSIQGLVLNDRPYFNEPGYEHGKDYECWRWTKKVMAYNEEALLKSCKAMIYTILNPPKNFEIFVLEHFRKRRDSILKTVVTYKDYKIMVRLHSITASNKFKSESIKMHSMLKKVFDIVSEPDTGNSEKFDKVKKEMRKFRLTRQNNCSIHISVFVFVFVLFMFSFLPGLIR